jgi:hypothetical protein
MNYNADDFNFRILWYPLNKWGGDATYGLFKLQAPLVKALAVIIACMVNDGCS